MNMITSEFDALLSNYIDQQDLYPDRDSKKVMFNPIMDYLHKWHFDNSVHYLNMIGSDGYQNNGAGNHGIPVRLFKSTDLLSVPTDKVVKTLLSSGTTGQLQSKIYLDEFNKC